MLDGSGEVEKLKQKTDGQFEDRFPKNIFEYPSSELTRFETEGVRYAAKALNPNCCTEKSQKKFWLIFNTDVAACSLSCRTPG